MCKYQHTLLKVEGFFGVKIELEAALLAKCNAGVGDLRKIGTIAFSFVQK